LGSAQTARAGISESDVAAAVHRLHIAPPAKLRTFLADFGKGF